MKIGFTCSSFDLLHAGHILMLKECKDHCDSLVVGLHSNPKIDRAEKNEPVQSMFERFLQLDAIKYVDKICVYDTEDDLLELMAYINPDIRFIGEDWRDKKFTGWKQAKLKAYKLYYNKRYGYSTTELRGRVADNWYIVENEKY
jgi:glycerol-3-phosphate cytidylyltransferase